jgi:N-acetylmuramic acid 6-phosphate etherase
MDLGNLANLQTEGVNPRTVNIDRISTLEMCTIINADDHKVSESVTPCLPAIAGAIDGLALRVRRGGRVIYVGAGTSGRLGVLDASEIPPTFAAPREQFVGLIAGGDAAIRQAQEGAEDDDHAGEEDMRNLNLNPELDSIIGIASSGRTPYVLGCLAFGKNLGCLTIGVVCAEPSAIGLSGNVDFLIAPVPGPEVVTGSTRLKAGTATKLVLNMLSTGTMIRTGKTYGNMVWALLAPECLNIDNKP